MAPLVNPGRFKKPPVALKGPTSAAVVTHQECMHVCMPLSGTPHAGAPQGALTVTEYPPARRGDTVDMLANGARMPDPYRWLEDPDAPETAACT
jgi:hypothetical protein